MLFKGSLACLVAPQSLNYTPVWFQLKPAWCAQSSAIETLEGLKFLDL